MGVGVGREGWGAGALSQAIGRTGGVLWVYRIGLK